MAKIIIETDEISTALFEKFKREIDFESLSEPAQQEIETEYMKPFAENIENADPEELKGQLINNLVYNSSQDLVPVIQIIKTVTNTQTEEN